MTRLRQRNDDGPAVWAYLLLFAAVSLTWLIGCALVAIMRWLS